MTSKKLFSSSLSALLLIAACALPARASAQNNTQTVVTTEQVRAELLAYAPDGVQAGKPVWVGLQITHQPEWHTYWKNSGDSGQPTTLTWTLPAGVSAGDIAWPLPTKIPVGNLANYGYGDTVLLPVPLTVSPQFKPLGSELEVKLLANWLVCKQECVPQDGQFTLRLPLQGSTALHAGAFDAAFKAQPVALAGRSAIQIDASALKVTVTGLPTALQGKTLEFFPETPEVIETAAAWTQSWQGATWHASVPIARHRSASPQVMPIVLAGDVAGRRSGFVTTAPVSGTWPEHVATPSASAAPALQLTPSALPIANTTLTLALLGALLGGMILNLMPCVFPVLAIKVVGFTSHGSDTRAQRTSGLAYSAGVVLSFAALGALMLLLRSAGEQLGWGFQLQSPLVVALLAALFTVLGLNLAGVFEFGQFVGADLASKQTRNPTLNAFLSGVLAVVIASPCTAPFMGASLGFALGLPAAQALLIFTTLGVGMALPFLALSWWPALGARLPRPGPWMLTFRHAMAFPMFATVVWLVWVLGQQSGINGAAALLALLVALALVLWSLTLQGRGKRVIATISIAIGALLTGAIGSFIVQPVAPVSAASASRWQPWSADKVTQLVAAGTPVFVDFTAAWCVTCQYNKQTTLADASVLADFDAKKVTLLRADWTRRDPAITAALAQLGRNGVPVYVLHAPGRAPVIFSEILSASALRAAVAAL
ncbi:MAG: protein-disulfide reductase [Comamonadaceae bacterium CG12_big_fil_rev_8_21_14_0_65_59_15]|nr:MAG: protein-disulfide reductase [Comamonadaceae bacterium CG12_big_fil_rev_8_21_14_0_65_59_15]